MIMSIVAAKDIRTIIRNCPEVGLPFTDHIFHGETNRGIGITVEDFRRCLSSKATFWCRLALLWKWILGLHEQSRKELSLHPCSGILSTLIVVNMNCKDIFVNLTRRHSLRVSLLDTNSGISSATAPNAYLLHIRPD